MHSMSSVNYSYYRDTGRIRKNRDAESKEMQNEEVLHHLVSRRLFRHYSHYPELFFPVPSAKVTVSVFIPRTSSQQPTTTIHYLGNLLV